MLPYFYANLELAVNFFGGGLGRGGGGVGNTQRCSVEMFLALYSGVSPGGVGTIWGIGD